MDARPEAPRAQARLVRLYEVGPHGRRFAVSPAAFLAWRDQNVAFDEIAGIDSTWMRLPRERGRGRDWVRGARISPNLFSMLGVQPALGRDLDGDDDQRGHERVAIVSHDFWERRLDGDAEALGRSIALDGKRYEVVGVMPEGFYFPDGAHVWIPLTFDAEERVSRRNRTIAAIGRIADYATVEQARDEIKGIMRRLGERYPESSWGWSADVVPLVNDGGRRVLIRHTRTVQMASGRAAFECPERARN